MIKKDIQSVLSRYTTSVEHGSKGLYGSVITTVGEDWDLVDKLYMQYDLTGWEALFKHLSELESYPPYIQELTSLLKPVLLSTLTSRQISEIQNFFSENIAFSCQNWIVPFSKWFWNGEVCVEYPKTVQE